MHRTLVTGHDAAAVSDAEFYDALRTHAGGAAVAHALVIAAGGGGAGSAVVDYSSAGAAAAAVQCPLYVDGVLCGQKLLGRSLQAAPAEPDCDVTIAGLGGAAPAEVYRRLQQHITVLGVMAAPAPGAPDAIVVATTADDVAALPHVLAAVFGPSAAVR
jgi:hypothetical protein